MLTVHAMKHVLRVSLSLFPSISERVALCRSANIPSRPLAIPLLELFGVFYKVEAQLYQFVTWLRLSTLRVLRISSGL